MLALPQIAVDTVGLSAITAYAHTWSDDFKQGFECCLETCVADLAARIEAVQKLADELDPPSAAGQLPRLDNIYGRRIRAALDAPPSQEKIEDHAELLRAFVEPA